MSISPRILFTSRGAPATFRKIREVVLTAAATSITFNGLDINTHRSYRLVLIAKNALGSAISIRLFVNNDQTPANYYSQYINASSGTVGAGRFNYPEILGLGANVLGLSVVDIFRDVDGYYRAIARGNYSAPSTVVWINYAVCKTATVTNITRLDIVSSLASGLAAGTRAILFAVGV